MAHEPSDGTASSSYQRLTPAEEDEFLKLFREQDRMDRIRRARESVAPILTRARTETIVAENAFVVWSRLKAARKTALESGDEDLVAAVDSATNELKPPLSGALFAGAAKAWAENKGEAAIALAERALEVSPDERRAEVACFRATLTHEHARRLVEQARDLTEEWQCFRALARLARAVTVDPGSEDARDLLSLVRRVAGRNGPDIVKDLALEMDPSGKLVASFALGNADGFMVGPPGRAALRLTAWDDEALGPRVLATTEEVGADDYRERTVFVSGIPLGHELRHSFRPIAGYRLPQGGTLRATLSFVPEDGSRGEITISKSFVLPRP